MQPKIHSNLTYKIGILGCPAEPDIRWTAENIERLKTLGFNALQLAIAWGYRPADEPLNLEDLVEIPPDRQEKLAQPVPLRCDPSRHRFEVRRSDFRHRIALCRAAGVRTVFNFGAPFNAHVTYGDTPPNCLLDNRTPSRYVELIRLFADQFPGVDDLLLYTYDQDAWLCGEFGDCPRCAGIPLHRRVTAFVNQLAEAWRRQRPEGRLWWEPWELSAGQVFQSVRLLNPDTVGLALHSNVAEVMATQPVDHWLQVVTRSARKVRLPVIVEHVLGNGNEELGAYLHIACPQVLLRALRAIAALPIDGIKEYYGLLPQGNDSNLKLTSIVLGNPQLSDAEVLEQLAMPYGAAAMKMMEFWDAVSEAMDLFPWAATWFMREFSRCNPSHGMGAAFLRGQQAHTPSWESSRRSIFMKTDDLQPAPWMLEDVQLQCELSAERAAIALELGKGLLDTIPASYRTEFELGLSECHELRRRILSYAYHIRETNLAMLMRKYQQNGEESPEHLREELLSILAADQKNQGQLEPCAEAIRLLQDNAAMFLETYFIIPETAPSKASPDFWTGGSKTGQESSPWANKGAFTVTSR